MTDCEQIWQAERLLFDNRDIRIAIMAEAAVGASFSPEERPSPLCLDANADAVAGNVRASGEERAVHAFIAMFDVARSIDLGLVRAEASMPIEGFHERQELREAAVSQKLAEIVTYGVWQPALFPNEVHSRQCAPKDERWSVWEVSLLNSDQPDSMHPLSTVSGQEG